MEKISYNKIGLSSMISRIPALFPFVRKNENGTYDKINAIDEVNGCYGQTVCDIKLPNNNIFGGEVCLVVNGEELLKCGETYSYRKLIEYYHRYKNSTYLDDGDMYKISSFIKFIDYGIGYIEVDDDIMKQLKSKYEELYDKDIQYATLIPDSFYLSDCIKKYNDFSAMKAKYDWYKTLVPDKEKDTLMYKYIEEFERMGGEPMMELYHSYIPEAKRVSAYFNDNNITSNNGYLHFNVLLTNTYNDNGIMSVYNNMWVGGKTYIKGEICTYNGKTYYCTKENHGEYDQRLMDYVFPSELFEEFSNTDVHPLVDIGCKEIGTEAAKECKEHVYTYSRLKSLRTFETYINSDDLVEEPDDNEDWLFYYRKGKITNVISVRDSNGNIRTFDDKYDFSANEEVDTLYLYGDTIEDISIEFEDREHYIPKYIRFKYRTSCHLTATFDKKEVNSNYDELYYFKNFKVDENSTDGITYFEKYEIIKDSELYNFINHTQEFEDVQLYFNTYIQYGDDGANYKFAFSTKNSKKNYTKKFYNGDYNYSDIESEIYTQVSSVNDFTNSPLYKDDVYANVHYQPRIENNVIIDRGNAAAFERHINLGHVKTLEDLENYSNGNLFTINNTI